MRNHTYLTLLLLLLTISVFGQKQSLKQKQLSKAIKKTWVGDDISFTLLSPIDNNTSNQSTINGEIFHIRDANSNSFGYAYAGRVFSCRSGGCSTDGPARNSENYEYFDYLILYNNALVIELVKVYNYQASHGHEVCSPSWLKQFKGYAGEKELDYGGNIDAISGATISAVSMIVDIENAASKISNAIQVHSESLH